MLTAWIYIQITILPLTAISAIPSITDVTKIMSNYSTNYCFLWSTLFQSLDTYRRHVFKRSRLSHHPYLVISQNLQNMSSYFSGLGLTQLHLPAWNCITQTARPTKTLFQTSMQLLYHHCASTFQLLTLGSNLRRSLFVKTWVYI